MNSLIMSLFAALLTVMPLMPMPPYSSGSIQSVSGIILTEDEGIIEILPAKDKSKTIILEITPESYIIDAVSGKPASFSERKDDKVVAYYRLNGHMAGIAAALIINIPEDYSPPVFARAAQVSRSGGQLYILTDYGVIVSISGDTPIDSFLSRSTVTIDNITENTDLLLWNQAYNMSIPARTAANKVIILGKARM